jgi:short subunit dehydrogenase-like uncharacterized protein
MVGEMTVSFALDGDRLPSAAGSLTPATAPSDVSFARLGAACHTYEVVSLI